LGEGHRFCGECGAAAGGCPSCGEPAVAGKRFCHACGFALSGPAPEPGPGRLAGTAGAALDLAGGPVAERRVCSVLFCDVVGFTPLSEARDPEAVRELLSRYFDVARTIVGRYGGVVEKFIGDAVMAVWGTPTATDSDAERAVRAALDLVSTVSELGAEADTPELAARAGVVTGEVAVSLGAVGEGMVAGDAVNTAARVQAAAEPGQVLVDEATHHLVASAIGCADAGSHRLKGKAEPRRLWRATRVLSAVGGVQRVDGLEAPLTGRDAELRTIKELFHATAERRIPRLVLISGPAGVGKSRLGWEFEKYADGLAGGGCGGTGAGACPTEKGWRSGRWPRLSASGWASPRKTWPKPPPPSWPPGLTGSSLTPANGPSSVPGWLACSVSALSESASADQAGRGARNCSPGGGFSSSGSRRSSRWCCRSRTPSTPTPGCWTSWTT